MRNAAVVNSGPLIALFDRDDAWHGPIVKFLRKYPGLRLLTTLAVLATESGIRQVLTLDRDFDIYRDAHGKRLKNLLAAIFTRPR